MNMNLSKKMLNHHIFISEVQNGDCIDWYIAVNSKVGELILKHNINVTDNRYYWQHPRFFYELLTLFKIPYWVRKTFGNYSERKKNSQVIRIYLQKPTESVKRLDQTPDMWSNAFLRNGRVLHLRDWILRRTGPSFKPLSNNIDNYKLNHLFRPFKLLQESQQVGSIRWLQTQECRERFQVFTWMSSEDLLKSCNTPGSPRIAELQKSRRDVT